jgi:uncharacterized RDD family membrane protein YckC
MQTIEIRTTQNVTIEYELASLRDRIFAFILDFILILIVYLVLLSVLESTIRAVLASSYLNMYFVYFLMPIFLFVLYQFTMELLANGQSVGKRMLGIKVVRLDGREPGATDYLLRAVFLVVDVILSSGVLAALLVGSTAKRQRLGDMTAHTTVVKISNTITYRLADVLRIDSLEAYEPRFPEIRNMNEQDMLLIKSALNRYQSHSNAAHSQVIKDLAQRMADLLGLDRVPMGEVDFLRTLIRDYIVLTR